jgi:hypothetical protein
MVPPARKHTQLRTVASTTVARQSLTVEVDSYEYDVTKIGLQSQEPWMRRTTTQKQ